MSRLNREYSTHSLSSSPGSSSPYTMPSQFPRRSSSIVHEIQPPKRRLSSHQMLLLTPFGGMLPSGALGRATRVEMEMGPSRGEPSMGRGGSNMGGPSSMGRTSSTMGDESIPLENISAPRKRQYSLGQQHTAYSPLTSAPMTTIPSASESSGGTSREVSNMGHAVVQDNCAPSVVHMSRSNSLPVLTLRELEALKEKDGELGIARGGGWAWVGRENVIEDEYEDELDNNTPLLTDSTTATCASVSSASSTTPKLTRQPSAFPFPFNDPFASTSPTPAMSREALPPPPSTSPIQPTVSYPFNSAYQPRATNAGYHYVPTFNDSRRVSDIPLLPKIEDITRSGSPGAPDRRPSAPVRGSRGRGLSTSSSRIHSPKTSRTPIAAPSPPRIVPLLPVTLLTIPTRPKILRYRSSPNEHNGLRITIRSGESQRRDSATNRLPPGNWAAVDVVHSLTSSAESSTAATHIAVFPPALDPTLPKSHIDEFGGLRDMGRSRFESVDSAFMTRRPVQERLGGSLNVGSGGSGSGSGGWLLAPVVGQGMTFPRRGSVVVLGGGEWRGDARLRVVSDGLGHVASANQHWSDRRGSWAEGWAINQVLAGPDQK